LPPVTCESKIPTSAVAIFDRAETGRICLSSSIIQSRSRQTSQPYTFLGLIPERRSAAIARRLTPMWVSCLSARLCR
jgi:hypothetical protein